MIESLWKSTKKESNTDEGKGKARLSAAQHLESKGSTAEALRAYEEGLTHLLSALRGENDGVRREALARTIELNMSKAEALKKRVSKAKPPDHHDYTKVPRRRVNEASAKQQTKVPPLQPQKGQQVPTSAPYTEQILSEMLDKSSGVTWDDIAGLAEAKRTLQEAVVLPHLRPDLYRGLRAPAKGVLLYGPPGTGKMTQCSSLHAFVSAVPLHTV